MNCSESSEMQISCGLCPAGSVGQFVQFSHLIAHLNDSHPPLRIFACHYCSQAFVSKGRFFSHDCLAFQKYFSSKRTGMYEDYHFAFQFRSLICCKCGLQVSIDDSLGSLHKSDYLHQLQRCFKLHEPESFVHCMVCLLEAPTFETVKVSFLTNDKTLRGGLKESFLPVYIAEATQLKDFTKNNANRDRVTDNFNGEEDLPRVKKGLTHSTFFNKIELEDGSQEYECKICKSRTIPNPRPIILVQHVRDNHQYNSAKKEINGGNHPRATFNAQIQFTRIDLGNGHCQYECKICKHLTKNNVKANALSQHFNDRHPEMRLLASETLVDRYLKRYGHLFLEIDEKDIESECLVVMDKGGNDMNDFVKDFLICETTIRITFRPPQIYQSEIPKGIELLDEKVYACELCDTLCSGDSSASTHFDQTHRSYPKTKFSVEDRNQVSCLSVEHMFRPAVRCLFCDTIHCSVMGLKLHLFRAHQAVFAVRPMDEGISRQNGPSSSSSSSIVDNLSSNTFFRAAEVKEEMDSGEFGVGESDLFDESSANFHSKIEQLLQTANSEIEKNEAIANDTSRSGLLPSQTELSSMFSSGNSADISALVEANSHISQNNTSPGNQFLEENDFERPSDAINDVDLEKHGENMDDDSSAANGTSIADDDENDEAVASSSALPLSDGLKSDATARALKLRARKYKIRRFNAQEQFKSVSSAEGPRYQCKICGHVTKPMVSANTLSQHFSYRHPEMRANAAGHISSFGRRKKPFSTLSASLMREVETCEDPPQSTSTPSSVPASTSSNVVVTLPKRRPNNPSGFNGRNGKRTSANNFDNKFNNNRNSSNDAYNFGARLSNIMTGANFDASSILATANGLKEDSGLANCAPFLQQFMPPFSDSQPISADDIVFGKFLQLKTSDEFERLDRSPTVFPYFEIVIKSNPKISSQLAGALSILYAENVNFPDRCVRISNFFGEILRRSRANNDNFLHSMDRKLAMHELNFSGILRILDDLLRKSGF